MLNFKCSQCQNDIQVNFEYIGEMVQCPFCSTLQIVPDAILMPGSMFKGHTVIRTISSTSLWTTYEIASQPNNLSLSIPTSFFLKRISDLPEFLEKVITNSTLNQPELPQLIDYSTTPNNCYFISDYNRDAFKLYSFIDENPLDYYNTLIVIRNIANTLSQLWNNYSLLHLAISPDNIFITNTLNVRIKNFGISEHLLQDNHLLESGFNIWDHRYMSPELIADGIANSPSSDIYSLGAILFLLTTGHSPNENIPPEQIKNALLPSLMDYAPNAPESLQILINMMMAHSIVSRLNSWQEVIKHIDTLITNQVANKHQATYNVQPKQTGYYEPIGLSAGEFTQNISREAVREHSHGKPQKNIKTIKPISKKSISTMNKQWKKDRPKRKSAYKHPKHSVKVNDNSARVVVLSIAGGLALVIFLVIFLLASNKSKKNRRNNNRPKLTQSEKRQQRYAEQLKQIAEEERKTAEAMRAKYAKPKDQLTSSNKSSTTKNRTTRTVSPEEKIDNVVTGIREKIIPYLKAGKFDKALNMLQDYSGPLAEESREKRVQLAEKIKHKIIMLERDSTVDADDDETTASTVTTETVNQPRPPNNTNVPQSSFKTLEKITKTIAPLLFTNRCKDVSMQLKLLIDTSNDQAVKTTLNRWLKQINNYETLKATLQDTDNAKAIIDAPENKAIMDKAYLLQALVYFSKEDFLKTKQSLVKLQNSMGNLFVNAMEASFL